VCDFLSPVSQKSTEQANAAADSANEAAQAAVDGVENAAVASGFVSAVSEVTWGHLRSHGVT